MKVHFKENGWEIKKVTYRRSEFYGMFYASRVAYKHFDTYMDEFEFENVHVYLHKDGEPRPSTNFNGEWSGYFETLGQIRECAKENPCLVSE